jgi:hypothetical protein
MRERPQLDRRVLLSFFAVGGLYVEKKFRVITINDVVDRVEASRASVYETFVNEEEIAKEPVYAGICFVESVCAIPRHPRRRSQASADARRRTADPPVQPFPIGGLDRKRRNLIQSVHRRNWTMQ